MSNMKTPNIPLAFACGTWQRMLRLLVLYRRGIPSPILLLVIAGVMKRFWLVSMEAIMMVFVFKKRCEWREYKAVSPVLAFE